MSLYDLITKGKQQRAELKEFKKKLFKTTARMHREGKMSGYVEKWAKAHSALIKKKKQSLK